MNRQWWVLAHRYVGLVLAGFLLIAGLTGSLLAFFNELDAAVSPQLFQVAQPSPDAMPLDSLTLRERLLAAHPHWSINYVDLKPNAGRSISFFVEEAEDNEVFTNPYSGEVLGSRKWGDITQGTKNLMPFIYELHYSLALGVVGTYAFGVIALLWTLDCFIGFSLTLPRGRRGSVVAESPAVANGRNWWSRWKPAWLVRRSSGSYKLNFDLHRAGGLWIWAMLLVIAWSSVAFNLREVYDPVTRALLDFPDEDSALPALSKPIEQPAIPWRAALQIGRRHMADEAARRGFEVHEEQWIGYDASSGLFSLSVNSSRDVGSELAETRVYFDANTGALKHTSLPTGEHSGTTVTSWLYSLHMAKVWGLPFRVFVCLVGLVVAMLSVTGVVIWLRKRRAARNRQGPTTSTYNPALDS